MNYKTRGGIEVQYKIATNKIFTQQII